MKRFQAPQRGAAPDVGTVSVAGPYNITGRGDTPSRARIFVCRPATEKDEAELVWPSIGRVARSPMMFARGETCDAPVLIHLDVSCLATAAYFQPRNLSAERNWRVFECFRRGGSRSRLN